MFKPPIIIKMEKTKNLEEKQGNKLTWDMRFSLTLIIGAIGGFIIGLLVKLLY